MNKFINTDDTSRDKLSRTACALLIPLTLLANRDNEIDKKKFMKAVDWITDYRTWNKYWPELVDQDILVHLHGSTWMVSPYECYAVGVSHPVLIHKWKEACNALN
jgi:hypothetical protein